MDEISIARRDPRDDERALLDHLLDRTSHGFELLREQAARAQVTNSSLWLIEFWVPRSAPAAIDVEGRSGRVVSRAVSESTDRWADAFLWLTEDGYINTIEIMWPDGERNRLPRPDELMPPIPP